MNTVIPSTPAPFGFDILAHNILGQPISHTSGQFAGRTIRTELRCWQSPLQGRKCATQTGPKVNSRKDCRRIDPPPIVGLRLFDCLPDGREVEIPDYREMSDRMQSPGMMCYTQLFNVSAPVNEGTTEQPLHEAHDASGETWFVYDSQKCSHLLFGDTFSSHTLLPHEDNNRGALVFAFDNLAIQEIGQFVLQFRTFDLSSGPLTAGNVVQAQCYSDVFTMYPGKNCPPLAKSTALTDLVAKYDRRIRPRHTERPSRRRSRREASSDAQSDSEDESAKKRHRSSDGDESNSEEE
ncbi:velvet factor-domain-containing protein [Mucidula mucida]|nr:velvet factor-domain-containing protein [Mucidula mucida]